MSGQDIIIEQLRAEVERLRDDRADLQERCNRLTGERNAALLLMKDEEARAEKAEEMLRQARTDRDREAFDRQTAQDAWNDMRRQRDAALVRAETAERFVAHADSEWKARAEKAERERDEWKAKHDTLADVSRACIATTERERDARPDISAEDARAFMMFKPVPARDSREGPVMHALRAHAAKAVNP